MILSDIDIADEIAGGLIKIEPFDEKCLGPNSYDVHLAPMILTYPLRHLGVDPSPAAELARIRDSRAGTIWGLDCKAEDTAEMTEHPIGPEGLILMPGWLYLASTLEYTETHNHVPYLDGKSSVGRLGIRIHATAGRGDVGFCGHWTMEIDVVHPVRVYAGMPIGQLTYMIPQSRPNQTYDKRTTGAQYNNRDPRPQPSRMWKNFK